MSLFSNVTRVMADKKARILALGSGMIAALACSLGANAVALTLDNKSLRGETLGAAATAIRDAITVPVQGLYGVEHIVDPAILEAGFAVGLATCVFAGASKLLDIRRKSQEYDQKYGYSPSM